MTIQQGMADENVAVLNQVTPAVTAATEALSVATTWYPLGQFENYLGILILGDMSAHDINASIRVGTDSSGAGDVAVVSATELVAHATNYDNKQVVMSCTEAQAVAALAGATHIGMRIISETSQTGISAGLLLGVGSKNGPASDFDGASVLEVVHVPD